ncbi:MAG TPA: hypothetical protein VN541_16930 [Tepidisphaeraceae bacterium]|nr:hypothetical protein [Tepidisphaeraceae bacterium]
MISPDNPVAVTSDEFPDGGPVTVSATKTLIFPAWQLALLSAFIPAWWTLRRVRSSLKIGHGGCAVCGYNLTGNTSGTCPECGTAITAPVPGRRGGG